MPKPPRDTYAIGPDFLSVADADLVIARHVIDEAKQGNPYPLFARIKAGTLTEDEQQFIVEIWGKSGKRGEAYMRSVRNSLICLQVQALINEGVKKEAAISEVAEARGLKRRAVFDILAKNKCKLTT